MVGPPGLRAFERAARPFMRRDFFALRLEECAGPSLDYRDSVKVTAAAHATGGGAAHDISYVFTAPAVRGKFDAAEAARLGVSGNQGASLQFAL